MNQVSARDDRPLAFPPQEALAQASVERFWRLCARGLRIAAFGHAAFCALFALLGAPALALANVASVSLYLACGHLVAMRRYAPVVPLVWIELVGHAALASRAIGWDSGFHYYMLIVLPLNLINVHRSGRSKLFSAGLLCAAYIGINAWTHGAPPEVVVGEGLLDGLRALNIACTFVGLGYLAHFHAQTVQQAESRLQAMASTDGLTGLANRRELAQLAGTHLAERHGGTVSLILCDIDHFKRINDSCGHAIGDAVLVAVARRLRQSVRMQDCVARWGGEEFLVLLPQTSSEIAAAVAERIRQAVLAEPVRVDGRTIDVTLTLGVAQCQRNERNVDAGVARADAALYRGKRAGRNRTEISA